MTTVATDTQIEALIKVAPCKNAQQKRVWAALSAFGRATDLRVASLLHWPLSVVTARRNELVDQGLVVDSGERHFNGWDVKAGPRILWEVGEPPDPAWLKEKVRRKALLKEARRVLMQNDIDAALLAIALKRLLEGKPLW